MTKHQRRAATVILFLLGFAAGAAVMRRPVKPHAFGPAMGTGPAWGHRMPNLRLDHPTFRQALNALAEQSGAKFSVDWEELKGRSVDVDIALSTQVDFHDVTVQQVLPIIVDAQTARSELDPLIAFQEAGGVVRISTDFGLNKDRYIVRMYDVRDLIVHLKSTPRPGVRPPLEQSDPDDPDPEERNFDNLLRTVDLAAGYMSWLSPGSGGQGQVARVDRGRFLVLQTPEGHRRIAELLFKIQHPIR